MIAEGGKTCERYEVPKLAVDNSLDFAQLHIEPRFQAWLDDRDLHSCLDVVSRSELPGVETVVKFQYNNPREQKRAHSPRTPLSTRKALHGTYVHLLARP